MNLLLKAAEGLDTTFHMAFDHIQQKLQYWLAEQKVSRILSYGGPLETLIEENLILFKKSIDYASNRMPGGGITDSVLKEL